IRSFSIPSSPRFVPSNDSCAICSKRACTVRWIDQNAGTQSSGWMAAQVRKSLVRSRMALRGECLRPRLLRGRVRVGDDRQVQFLAFHAQPALDAAVRATIGASAAECAVTVLAQGQRDFARLIRAKLDR